MRKQSAYAASRARDAQNISEKSVAIRHKMQEKSERIDELTADAGKALGLAFVFLLGTMMGAVMLWSRVVGIVLPAVVLVALLVYAGRQFGKARHLMQQPVAIDPDGNPLVM